MLHIILLILKTIGIIFGIILGILLTLILLVLFVPIRYTVKAEKHDDFVLNGKIGWLFRILYLRIMYQENKFHFIFKIFGFVFYDSHKPKKLKKKKKELIKNKKSNSIRINSKKRLTHNNNRIKKEDHSKVKYSKEKNEDHSKNLENKSNSSASNAYQRLLLDKHTNAEENNRLLLDKHTNAEENNRLLLDKHTNTEENNWLLLDKHSNTKENNTKDSENKSKPNIIKRIWIKALAFIDRLKSFFGSFIDKCKAIFQSLKNIKKFISSLFDFIMDEENKRGIKCIFLCIKKALKRIFPKKIKARLKFGTGDPCSTGQILAGIAVFFPIYHDKITIVPDFENEIIEGKGFVSGRIRLISLLIIGIKLIYDKDFKQLLKNIKNFKEEL